MSTLVVMAKKIDKLMLNQTQGVYAMQIFYMSCDYCCGSHPTKECLIASPSNSNVQANAINRGNFN